ncbi:MAG: hypothetical protein ACI81W_002962, partial [Saprospiraceae bacterium]
PNHKRSNHMGIANLTNAIMKSSLSWHQTKNLCNFAPAY